MKVLLAVNGTLMNDEPNHQNLVDLGATFVRQDKTLDSYRLFSINDEFPAMIYEESINSTAIRIELYEIDEEKLPLLMEKEPKELRLDKVCLSNHTLCYGIVAKQKYLYRQKEITRFGGWKAYKKSLEMKK